jgi:hypothetical protein
MRVASHHGPDRLCSTGSDDVHERRSAERDSHTSARWVCAETGRWNSTYFPSICRGSREAFLSSGGMMMP